MKEYDVINIINRSDLSSLNYNIKRELNSKGYQRWELNSSIPIIENGKTVGAVLILEREKG